MARSSPSKTRAVPSKVSWSSAGHLDHRPFRGQGPGQHGDTALDVDGVAHDVDHVAVGSGWVEGGQVLGHRPTGDGQAVPVEQSGLEQLGHHHRDPTDPIDIGHVVLPVGLGVGQVGHPGGHGVEVVQLQLDPRLVGDGQQVEYGVGRAPEGHGHGDGVLEGLLGHDLAGPDPEPEQLHHGLAGGEGGVVPTAVDSRSRRAARQRHAQGLGHRGHGVGGEHARRTTPRWGRRCAR